MTILQSVSALGFGNGATLDFNWGGAKSCFVFEFAWVHFSLFFKKQGAPAKGIGGGCQLLLLCFQSGFALGVEHSGVCKVNQGQ